MTKPTDSAERVRFEVLMHNAWEEWAKGTDLRNSDRSNFEAGFYAALASPLAQAQGEPIKLFKTSVLGVGPYCVEFSDGKIVYMRSEARQKAIGALYTPLPARAAPTDCGEYGHAQGACGNASCVAAQKAIAMQHVFEFCLSRRQRCDIMACNCGSWHARYGLPERMAEVKEALAGAGHPLCNENGNLVSNALAALIAERDALAALPAATPAVQAAQAQGEPDMPAICAALGFDPTNHHNASMCPYCRPAEKVTPPAVQPIDRDLLIAVIAEALSGTLHCSRAWSAWSVNTMREDDFSAVEDSDTPSELADAVISAISACQATPPAVQPAPLSDVEIQALWNTATGAIPGWSRHIVYGRVIEAAVLAKIKGAT